LGLIYGLSFRIQAAASYFPQSWVKKKRFDIIFGGFDAFCVLWVHSKKNLWSKTTKFFDKGKAVLVNRGLLTLFKKVTLYWKIQKMLGLKLVNFMGKGIEFLPQTKKI